MVQKSYTRVTLALDIVKKLQDGPYAGYHELAIIKHQIDLYDTVSIEDAPCLSICCNNPLVPCDSNNICWKAVELVKREFKIDKSVKIDLEKNIPVMGGLAGGSANAATVLMLLNQFWQLGLSTDQLMKIGRKLGMDVPYYFLGGTVFDSEATGVLRKIQTDLKFVFLLVIPDFGVSTAKAYQQLNYSLINNNRDKTLSMAKFLQDGDYHNALKSMHNDFEHSVFLNYPELKNIKETLINAGCAQAIMSGSGSTIMGVTDSIMHAQEIQKKVPFKTTVVSTL
jgi:4-diphosphocytidyl-2-C-methyl-D-erythritol kinase